MPLFAHAQATTTCCRSGGSFCFLPCLFSLRYGRGSSCRQKRWCYSLELKLKVIEEAKRSSKKKVAELLLVPRMCVRDWCSQEKAIREEFKTSVRSSKHCRVSGGGRPAAMVDLEDQLFDWCELEFGEKKLAVSRNRMILKSQRNLRKYGSKWRACNYWRFPVFKRLAWQFSLP